MKKFVFLSAVIGIFFALTISMGATAFAYTWHHTESHAWDTVYNDHHYFMDGNLTLTEHYDGCHGLGLYNYTTYKTYY
jgi:Tfp pilus tip-associated adhesin PilY1